MYSISDYANMMADRVRVDAYAEALRRTVKPDSIVVDIGAGTGTFSILACRLGAQRVYSIEPNDAIHVGREVAAASGFADRIEFLQAASTEVVLPERADIIVSDIRGVLPLFGRHVPSIADARQRLLAETGVLIPRRDRLWAALAEAPAEYQRHVSVWGDRTYGLDLHPIRDLLANTWRKVRLTREQLLAEPREIALLDYREIQDSTLDADVRCVARRTGTAHGLCIWFDAELTDEVGFSNAPGEVEAIYGQGFFPFAAPVQVETDDVVSVRLRAGLCEDDYVWRWTLYEAPLTYRSTLPLDHSTLHGVPLVLGRLRKGASDYVPRLALDGEIDLFVLERMRAATPLGEIANELLSRFPRALSDWNAALGRVGELSRKYSKA